MRKLLREMNVTDSSLYPGLDGFARSLSYHLGNMRPGRRAAQFADVLTGADLEEFLANRTRRVR
jgi:hypothetical protein